MDKSIDPCPMCGHHEDEHIDRINRRENETKLFNSFLAGRRSWNKLSRRENEVFDAFYDLGITDFKKIARNFDIKVQSVMSYYDRAMDKITTLL